MRRALAAETPPKYERAAKGSIVDAVEPQVRELLAEWPTMPATVIAERIGWSRSLTVLKDRVRELRPQYQPPDPASRTEYRPGELAQCDLWFPPAQVPLGAGQVGSPPVLVMVAGYSRIMTARMLPSRQGPDLLAGHWRLLSELGRGAAGAGLGQRVRGRLLARRAPAADRGDDRVPRRARDQGDPVPSAGSGGQGPGRAGQQVPGDLVPARTRVRLPGRLQRPARGLAGSGQPAPAPSTRLPADRPLEARPGRDGGVAAAGAGGCDVGLDHQLAAAAGSLRASGRQRLLGAPERGRAPRGGQRRPRARHGDPRRNSRAAAPGGARVARHDRCWARHQTITDPEHARAAATLRQARHDQPAPTSHAEVAYRDLADYDRLFGLDDSHASIDDGHAGIEDGVLGEAV